MLLAKFSAMKDKLAAKDTTISHAEIPVQFIQSTPNKRKVEDMEPYLTGQPNLNQDCQ